MSRIVKLATSAGLSMASLGLMASTAFAGGYPVVYNTGDCFHLNNNHNTNIHVSVNNNNTAYINQMAYNMVNTGYNTSNQNIWGGGIRTGNAMVNNYFSVSANNNWTSINIH